MKRAAIFASGLLMVSLLSIPTPVVAAEADLCVSHPGASGTLLEPAPVGPEFGDYKLVPLIGDGKRYAGPRTPKNLANVTMTDSVDRKLGPKAERKLARNGFVIVPARFRLFHHAYDEQFYSGTPVFVTTDVAYHTWHLVFDKVLRDLEQQRLLPALEELVTGMRQNAATQQAELAGTELEDDAAAVHDLLSVAVAELGSPTGGLSDRAEAEKALIDAHSEATASPILGTTTDYSLFTPRGHYTRTEDLTRYFTAMSVLGQHAFRLPGSLQTDATVVNDPRGVRLALLASRTLVGHPELEALWQQIFEPTAFLVGTSDDYSPFELAEAVEATAPGGMDDPLFAADDASLVAVADTLKATRPVQIDPERPSIRLMGTRFVLDSWILDQMVGPCVGVPGEPRPLASPLDLAATFGSTYALAIQRKAGETAFPGYDEQMSTLRRAVAKRPDDAWGRTVYDAWLAAAEPMWLPHGKAFPDFMRGKAWKAKAQQTGFGSYAELKHDTILYTKQAVGEMGSAGKPPPPARHWVEPDPVAFKRLSAMAALTRDGLDGRELLAQEQRNLLDGYVKLVDRFAAIASDELKGKPISKRDNFWLKVIGGVLEGFWWRTGDELDYDQPIIDDDAAIIADIMRGIDYEAGTDKVLEIGTGRIDRIFVIVPNDDGVFQVASGGVYSYYEFPWPTTDRLTDEQWWKMLKKGEAPDRPSWQEPLFP